MTTPCEKSNIGRMAVVVVGNHCYVGNVVDLVAGTDTPKRIRIQYDLERQGDVLMPSEYQFKQWSDSDD